MSVEIKVPDLPESVADATVATWHKQPGDFVERDEVLVDIETDKVVLEVPAPETGVLDSIVEEEGATVLARQLLANLLPGQAQSKPATKEASAESVSEGERLKPNDLSDLSPTVRRLVAENDLDLDKITGTGKAGRVTKKDVEAKLAQISKASASAPEVKPLAASRSEERVPMTRLRKRVAERLLEAKNSTAMLTTFNEIDMQPVMELRKKYRDLFEKKHGIRLGFMSFYVKAVVEALKQYPEVNASIDGDDIVYHNYFDVSIAVSTPRGLVTPVLRDCDQLSMAEIEEQIKNLAVKGQDGKLTVEELMGGNFTITNGGVFGSLMSTPIINPPQSAILGMHKIQDRPVAINGQVEIRPMMYVALSYDHRIIDGRESVGFLVKIKELLEDPNRLLLSV
ncbi:2-oxoglutarate dehydrogenase complex dihydrolipoyllysine-residue succinyltransferase [Dongshaea marina]|uniref:2-oxoglutarate dehydrogenase complex dihydrolipoyllysine-residue succinyltransferase n=1 Tax=Dongshaea marina TaxID=2047966 RepID=UPI000D3E4C2A|nr:2-oxoglutarate dehydrogenase complex dihydrolipoyllysine-residue succinyltransferase [Dongshaea marina]